MSEQKTFVVLYEDGKYDIYKGTEDAMSKYLQSSSQPAFFFVLPNDVATVNGSNVIEGGLSYTQLPE